MQAFGIAALVFAIIGVLMPLIGYFISGLSGILAFFSYGKGTTLGLSSIIINIINIIFLSPSLVMLASDKYGINKSHQSQSETIFTVLLLIQIAALGFFVAKKYGWITKVKQLIK